MYKRNRSYRKFIIIIIIILVEVRSNNIKKNGALFSLEDYRNTKFLNVFVVLQ